MRRLLHDAFKQASAVVVVAVGGLLVFGGAVALSGVAGRFGPVGWIIFAILMGGWLMFFSPFLVAGLGLRRSGSPAKRKELEDRIAEQRRKYAIVLARAERSGESVERPAPAAGSDAVDDAHVPRDGL